MPVIKILYEDNHLLVVEKPVNILSQGDDTRDSDLLTMLKEDLKRRYNKPGDVYLGLVHRLDRPVGGVMVFARTSKAAARLSEQVRRREFGKTYAAVIHGILAEPEGRLEHYLLKDRTANITKIVNASDKEGRKAILNYRVVDRKSDLSLVKINLETGRSHQIRVQFSSIGHPLFGDQKYGAGKSKPGEQVALWSIQIELIHPTRREPMAFQCLPPAVYPWNLFGCPDNLFA